MSELADYIDNELIRLDYGEYLGVSEPNGTQLFILKGLIEQQLFRLRNKELANNEKQ